MVLPVEGCEFGYIEGAAVHVSIIGIIESETNMEAIGRRRHQDLIRLQRFKLAH